MSDADQIFGSFHVVRSCLERLGMIITNVMFLGASYNLSTLSPFRITEGTGTPTTETRQSLIFSTVYVTMTEIKKSTKVGKSN